MRGLPIVAMVLSAFAAGAGERSASVQTRVIDGGDRDLRLRTALRDGRGDLLIVYTARDRGAGIDTGDVFVRSESEGRSRAVPLVLPHGQVRHSGDHELAAAMSDRELAVAVRTRDGVALCILDRVSLRAVAALHRRADAAPLYLQALADGAYRIVTTSGVWRWQPDGEVRDEWRFDTGDIATAAVVVGESIGVLGLRQREDGRSQPLDGLFRPDSGGNWWPSERRMPAAAPPLAVLPAKQGVDTFFLHREGGRRDWWRISYDRDMQLVERGTVDLPDFPDGAAGLGVMHGEEGGVVAGGLRGSWLAARVTRNGVERLHEFDGDSHQNGWQLMLDLQTLPGKARDTTTILSTVARPDADSDRVKHLIQVQTLTLEDGSDAHAAGSAD